MLHVDVMGVRRGAEAEQMVQRELRDQASRQQHRHAALSAGGGERGERRQRHGDQQGGCGDAGAACEKVHSSRHRHARRRKGDGAYQSKRQLAHVHSGDLSS